jgi:hypothetical protein
MLIGTNWLFGWSHTGHIADTFIKDLHAGADSFVPIPGACLRPGVDAIAEINITSFDQQNATSQLLPINRIYCTKTILSR